MRFFVISVCLLAAPVSAAQIGALPGAVPPGTPPWPAAVIEAMRDPDIMGLFNRGQAGLFRPFLELDYSAPVNLTRLEPMIGRLELSGASWPLAAEEFRALSPRLKSEALFAAMRSAKTDADRRAQDMLERLRGGKVPQSGMRSFFLEAERLALFEGLYLDPPRLRNLQKVLPRVLARARLYEASAVAGRRDAIERELDIQAPPRAAGEESGGGGLMEAPPPKEGALETDGYDGFLFSGDGDFNGYDGYLNEAADEHSRRNRNEEGGLLPSLSPQEEAPRDLHRYDLPGFRKASGGAGFDAAEDGFPFEGVRRVRYAGLVRAAEEGRARRYWRLAAKAYGQFDRFISVYLAHFEAAGRLGPAARDTIERLRAQNERLFGLIQGLASRARLKGRYGWFDRNDPQRWRSRISDTLHDFQLRLDTLRRRKDSDAEDAFLRAEEEREDARLLARRLVALGSYYRWRLAAALRDQDPGHLQELFAELAAGTFKLGPKIYGEGFQFTQERIPQRPALSRLIELRSLAARRGAGEVPGWRILAYFLGASAYPIGAMLLVLWLPPAAALIPFFEITAVGLAAALAVHWVRTTVAVWRFGRLAGLLSELSLRMGR